jgi:hypothetical protein
MANVGLNEGAYLHWIATFIPTMRDLRASDRILFIEESGEEPSHLPYFSHRSLANLILSAKPEFVCASRPGVISSKISDIDEALSMFSMFAYHNWSLLRKFSLDDHKLKHGVHMRSYVNATFKKFNNLGEWFDSVVAPTNPIFPTDTVEVCYQGTFIVAAKRIFRQPKATWTRMYYSLFRGTSIEESHFVERIMAGLLAPNLRSAEKLSLNNNQNSGFKLYTNTYRENLIGALMTPWVPLNQPSLFIIGAQKSSTTALAKVIASSPKYDNAKSNAPSGFETHFFDDQIAFGFDDDENMSPSTILERYQDEFFTHAKWGKNVESRAFDKTPSYLFMGHKVAPLMKRVVPWAQLIAILRSPVQRAMSQFRHNGFDPSNTSALLKCIQHDLQLLNESKVLDLIQDLHAHCILNEDEYELLQLRWRDYVDRIGFHWRNSSCQGIIGRGLYWPQLSLFKSLFPNLLLIRTETFKSRPRLVSKALTSFLQAPIRVNNTQKGHKSSTHSSYTIDPSILTQLERVFKPFDHHLGKCMSDLFYPSRRNAPDHAAPSLGSLRLHQCASADTMDLCAADSSKCPSYPSKRGHASGVVVLGMHRSGTSALSGILSIVYGLDLLGDEMIEIDATNPKGYFENMHLVYQNEQFMSDQNMPRYEAMQSFDPSAAARIAYHNVSHFNHGFHILRRFYIASSQQQPWLVKDPRLCFTLPVWLCLMDGFPGVVFIYRDPVEVAKSLHKKSAGPIEFGLWFWLENNMLAIRNSGHLCRVVVAHEDFYNRPVEEIERIGVELRQRCGVINIHSRFSSKAALESTVTAFIESSLRHHHTSSSLACSSSSGNISSPVDLDSFGDESSGIEEIKAKLIQAAYSLFCDIRRGLALSKNYDWSMVQEAINLYKDRTTQAGRSV